MIDDVKHAHFLLSSCGVTAMSPSSDKMLKEAISSLETALGKAKQKTVTENDLIQSARDARKQAFCPYSEYSVGAALETDVGVFTGANIEVSGRSTSVHAEMLAFFNAVQEGAQEFKRMAVSPLNQSGEACCGLCQHTMAQFTDELEIIEDCGDAEPTRYLLSELIGPAYSPSTRKPNRQNVLDKDGDYEYDVDPPTVNNRVL